MAIPEQLKDGTHTQDDYVDDTHPYDDGFHWYPQWCCVAPVRPCKTLWRVDHVRTHDQP